MRDRLKLCFYYESVEQETFNAGHHLAGKDNLLVGANGSGYCEGRREQEPGQRAADDLVNPLALADFNDCMPAAYRRELHRDDLVHAGNALDSCVTGAGLYQITFVFQLENLYLHVFLGNQEVLGVAGQIIYGLTGGKYINVVAIYHIFIHHCFVLLESVLLFCVFIIALRGFACFYRQ